LGEIKQSGVKPADGPEIAVLKELDVLIYGLKNCDTCRKAKKALPHAQLIDVREEGVPEAVLTQAYERFGTAVLNTRSTTWRGLDDEARAEAYPALMKRPLIAMNDTFFLGWNNDIEGEVKAML